MQVKREEVKVKRLGIKNTTKKLNFFLLTFLLLLCFPLAAQDAGFYYEQGLEYYKNREYELAVEFLGRAIELDPENALYYHARENAYAGIYDPAKAVRDYTRAINLDPYNASYYYNRGDAYREGLLEIDPAIEDYTSAINLDPKNPSYYHTRALLYRRKNDTERALKDYTQAINLAPNNPLYYTIRGSFYQSINDLDNAIKDFNEVVFLNPKSLLVWYSLGQCYLDIGQPEKAIEIYTLAIEANPNLASSYYLNIGNIYYDLGDPDKAITNYNASIELDPNDPIAWLYRGDTHFENENYDLAIKDYRQTIETAGNSDNLKEALDFAWYAWEFAGFIYQHYTLLNDNINCYDIDMELAGIAREALNLSITKAEQLRSTMDTMHLLSSSAEIMTRLLYQYYAAVDFEATFGLAENAFKYSEGLRSRGFLDQMSTEAALSLPGITQEEKRKVQELIEEIENLRERISRFDAFADSGERLPAIYALSRAEETLITLDDEISKKVPLYGELRKPKTANLTDAQNFCGDDQVILEYVIWESSVDFNAPSVSGMFSHVESSFPDRPAINSYCLVITKDNITPVRLDPYFDYAGKVNDLRNKLLRLRAGRVPAESTFEAERNELYNALIKPVLEHIPGNIKNLLIVPDGNLAFLPFDILRESPGDLDLGEQYSIAISPSVSISILSKQNEIALNEPVLAFGGVWYETEFSKNNPPAIAVDSRLAALEKSLEEEIRGGTFTDLQEKMSAANFYSMKQNRWEYLSGTVDEIQGLEGIATASPKIIQGREASMAKVKELSLQGTLRNYPIIHFACHGYFNDNLIPQAALVLSEVSGLLKDESAEDGYLSIEEIALLQLNAKMIMLSACETGRGQLKRGDGMSGLARSFMVAGAQNVGVSLWKISDSATVEFMWGVYRKVIREGKTFREAYSEVKAEFRKNERWSHPYYWAGFTFYE